MGRNLAAELKIPGDAVQDLVDVLDGDGRVFLPPVVGETAEHVVGQTDVWRVLEIERHRLDNRRVNGDVAVLPAFPGVPCFLFQNREAVLEGQVVVNEIGKAQTTEIGSPEAEVDADDEQHVVPPAFLGDQVFRDAHDVVHVLDRLGGVLGRQILFHMLRRRSDQAFGEPAVLLQRIDIDKRLNADNVAHQIPPLRISEIPEVPLPYRVPAPASAPVSA